MDANKLPLCRCGSTAWNSHGGSFSSGHSASHYKCMKCGRMATHFKDRGGNLFLVSKESAAIDAWLEGPVTATWADRAQKIQALQDEHQHGQRFEIVRKCGFDPGLLKDAMTEPQWDAWRAAWDVEDKAHPFVVPEQFQHAPDLPRAPVGLHGFILRKGEWSRIDPVASARLPVPPHPRRVRNAETFARLFADLSAKTGQQYEPFEIANGYSPASSANEPWYRFDANGKTYTAGARRRVYELVCESSNGPLIWETLAKRDGVTFDSAPYLIHAWGYDKMLEYLLAAVES